VVHDAGWTFVGGGVKLLHSDGRTLEIRDVGPPIMRLRAGTVPLKLNGWHIKDDDEARDIIRELLATGLYLNEPV
jgi:hypothetical protein